MKKIYILTILTLGLACNNLKPFDKRDYSSLTFGYYCGECNGKCFQGYHILNDSIYRIGLSYNDFLNISSITFDTLRDKTLLGKTESLKIEEILKLLPGNIYNSKTTFGKPDNHDQCGIMIFLRKDRNKSKRILIDTDKENCPVKFHKFIDAVVNLKLV